MPKNKFTYNQNIVATCLPLVPYTLHVLHSLLQSGGAVFVLFQTLILLPSFSSLHVYIISKGWFSLAMEAEENLTH